MARRKMDLEHEALIKGLLQHYQPRDVSDVHEMLKYLLGDVL